MNFHCLLFLVPLRPKISLDLARTSCWCCRTFLGLLFHSFMNVIKHLGHHSSKLLHHTLAKVQERVHHLLQTHTLQKARVPCWVVGLGGGFLHQQEVGVVQEGSLEGFVEPIPHCGHQGDAPVHQHAHSAYEVIE